MHANVAFDTLSFVFTHVDQESIHYLLTDILSQNSVNIKKRCDDGVCLLLVGELDHLPEVAFYMVGPIEEVVTRAEKLAEST